MDVKHSTTLWLEATRPKTLLASLAPLVLAFAMAYKQGTYNISLCLWTLLSALLIQILTNFANDYYDYLKGADTPKRIGPRRLLQTGALLPYQVRRALIAMPLAIILSLIPLIQRGGWSIVLLGVIAILLAFAYTAGPFALAYTGWGDIVVFLSFGPLAVASALYIQTLQWNTTALLTGLIPGSISTAILIANNLRDFESDQTAQKRTLVVRWGRFWGTIEYIGCLILPIVITLLQAQYITASIGSLFAALLIASVCRAKIAPDYIPLLGKTALFNFLYCLSLALEWSL